MNKSEFWWEQFELGDGNFAECRIGEAAFNLQKGQNSWLIETLDGNENGPENTSTVSIKDGAPPLLEVERFVFSSPPKSVVLRPKLADRPVVVRPRFPVSIPPKEKAVFFISTPVWISIEVGDKKQLKEIPSVRMSDSWFGPNTMDGELCYATPTQARAILADVPRRLHRAVTTINIVNEAGANLPVERLSLPAPMLSIFSAEDGSLWSEEVTLVSDDREGLARLHIEEKGPKNAKQLLSGPRTEPGKGRLVRAFAGLFG